MLHVISLATHDCILSMADTNWCWLFVIVPLICGFILIAILWKELKNDWTHCCKIPCTLVQAYLRDVRDWDSKNPTDTTLPSLGIKYESVWLLLKSSSKLPTQMEYLHKAFPPLTTDKRERKSPLLFSCYDCLLYPWLDFMV